MGVLTFYLVQVVFVGLLMSLLFVVVGWVVLRVMTKENPSILRIFVISVIGVTVFLVLAELWNYIVVVLLGPPFSFLFPFNIHWILSLVVGFFLFWGLFKYWFTLSRLQAALVSLIMIILALPFLMLAQIVLSPFIWILYDLIRDNPVLP